MNADKPANKLPNFTQRMLWVFAGQMLLVVVLFVWSDLFPSWLNQMIMVSVLLFPPLAYMSVLTRPALRRAWCNLLLDSWALLVYALVAFVRLFRPSIVVKLVRLVITLKPMPTTADEWITCCVLPFKTCIVATFPLIWTFEKIISHFQPHGRSFGASYELIFQCYLSSLLALPLGALLQAIFCRAGRATMTLRFFLLGLVLLFIFMIFPRAF